ncbi:MAG: A24 family peptidase [Lachnospiraceae bacterium]
MLLLSGAVIMDIRSCRISNRLILCGMAAGLWFQSTALGVEGVLSFIRNISIPVILLYLLFLMRALGAGDIKLFSVVGGIWNLEILKITLVAAFFTGAVMSLCVLIYHQNLNTRLRIFGIYLRQVMCTGRITRYPKESKETRNFIHFSIAILIGFIVALGVVY